MAKKIVYLYSRCMQNIMAVPKFAASVCVDDLTAEDLSDVHIAVYTAGAFYNANTFRLLCDYYKKGGTLILPGAKPLSKPYYEKDGTVLCCDETNAAIRALGPVEQYVETGSIGADCLAKVQDLSFRGLQSAIDMGAFRDLANTFSAHYTLARYEKDEDDAYLPDARLDVAVRIEDASGHCIAAPVVRIVHKFEGELWLLNFAAQEGYYETIPGKVLLQEIIACAQRPRVRTMIEPVMPRYKPGEETALKLHIQRLADKETPIMVYLDVHGVPDGREVSLLQFLASDDEEELPLGVLPEGRYRVTMRLFAGAKCIEEKVTGFYVISDENLLNEVSAFPRVTLDTAKTADYFLQNGEVFTMHGTTHFVTDVYRHCFHHMNVELCDRELAQIVDDGFNILRTGNWRMVLSFVGPDGECPEHGLRALDAYFLTAARHGLTVQFVHAHSVFNNWDRDLDPLHNPAIRNKVMRVFDVFTRRYAAFGNVQTDIINEPSYSYRGGWTLGRPSGDPYEKLHWSQFLEKKYGGDLAALHDAWRITSADMPTFADAIFPRDDEFDRFMSRTEIDRNYNRVTDFFEFARASYSDWVHEIREIARRNAPDMVVMMGRDESIRIPSQQDEIAAGNLDFSNWHQWNTNSITFVEYFLNKVRSLPCCGQELGIYQQEDGRGFKSLSESRRAGVLEKKLLYSFGNWLQWQIKDDPYLNELCETTLGLYRADGTETPSLRMNRALNRAEEGMRKHLSGRDESAIRILTVHPTYHYFGMTNPLASQGVRSHVLTLHYALGEQSDCILEHLFTEENRRFWGDPDVIFVPGAQVMADNTWQLLCKLMQQGATVVLSGAPERDEFFRKRSRVNRFLEGAHAEPAYGIERIVIDGKAYSLDFRRITGYADAGHAVEKIVVGEEENAVRILPVGKGKLIHCTLPLEFSESADAVEAFYRMALREAGYANRVMQCDNRDPAVMVYPMVYKSCTVYTLVNEGAKTAVEFTDLATGKKVSTVLPANSGAKLCLGKDGTLIEWYAHEPVTVGSDVFPANA